MAHFFEPLSNLTRSKLDCLILHTLTIFDLKNALVDNTAINFTAIPSFIFQLSLLTLPKRHLTIKYRPYLVGY